MHIRLDTLTEERAALDALAVAGTTDDGDAGALLGRYVRIRAAAEIALREATTRLGARLSVADTAQMLGRLDAGVKPRMDAWYAARPAVPLGLLLDASPENYVKMSRAAEVLGVSRHAVAAMGYSGELQSVITPTGRVLFDISGMAS